MLVIALQKQLGTFSLQAEFRVNGGVTALFGRSGSGKTSLLRQIAGLAKPDIGHIRVNDRVLVDTKRGLFLPPHKRHFGFVFQDARLFSHLTVQQNLDYGRFFAGNRKRNPDIAAVISILGLEALLTRKPDTLSGGEKQRVAIGRALFSAPDLLLLDEPLASLDQARKQEILPLLEQMRDVLKVPMIYVSHSAQEVARLATTVVVLKDGKAEQVGSAAEVLNQQVFFEATERQEAGSFVSATVESYDVRHGLNKLVLSSGSLFVPGEQLSAGQQVRVQVLARDVMISTQKPDGLSALNVVEGTIAGLAEGDDRVITVTLDCAGTALAARLTTLSAERLKLAKGMIVYAVIKTVALDQRS